MLVTDHTALQWMARTKETNAQVTRWFLALQDFHFRVQHWTGASHGNADEQSRKWSRWTGRSVNISPLPLWFPLSPHRRTRMTLLI